MQYNLDQYVSMTKISNRTRILVEGKDDRAILRNLLDTLGKSEGVRIDAAVDLKGTCSVTAKNHRAKVEKIHMQCQGSADHRRLFFLCDREFRSFRVEGEIYDEALEHCIDGNLFWTLGHSIENYFLSEDVIVEGCRFLCGSGYKSDAVNIFRKLLEPSIRFIAKVTLAAKTINKSGYPQSVISWEDIEISPDFSSIDFKRDVENSDEIYKEFCLAMEGGSAIVEKSGYSECSRFCRGHTAILMLRNVFAACVYHAANSVDKEAADRDARAFFNVSESALTSALSEAWIRRLTEGVSYPEPLVVAI